MCAGFPFDCLGVNEVLVVVKDLLGCLWDERRLTLEGRDVAYYMP